MATSQDETGPDEDDAHFAKNMQKNRESAGLSQAGLVRKLRLAGWDTVHQTTISRIEKGERPVRLGEAKAIARALDVPLELMSKPSAESEALGKLRQTIGMAKAYADRLTIAEVRYDEAMTELVEAMQDPAQTPLLEHLSEDERTRLAQLLSLDTRVEIPSEIINFNEASS